MTTQLIDSFNRTAADLGASPSGRWSIQLLSGTTAAIATDGQSAFTASTWTANTRGAALWIGADPGSNHGRWRARLKRSSTDITLLGLVFRSNNDDPSVHDRLFFGYDLAASGWALRRYVGSTSIGLTYGTSASTLDTDWHLYEVTMTDVGGGNVSIVAKIDGVTKFSVIVSDIQTVVSATERRGFGFEAASVSGGGWSAAADIAYCDVIDFDDLVVRSAEFAPELEDEPTLTPLTVSSEMDDATSDGLPVTPDWAEEVSHVFAVEEAPTEADYVASWALTTVQRRTWRVGWQALSSVQFSTLDTFFEDYLHVPFKYDDPTGNTVVVKVVDGSWSASKLAPNVYGNASALLVEVI